MTTKNFTDRLPATEDILGRLGLATQRSANEFPLATGLATFALGVLVGGALALLYAPRTGRELRRDVGERLTSVKDRVTEAVAPQTEKVRQAVS